MGLILPKTSAMRISVTERTKVIVVAKDGITVEHLPSWDPIFASTRGDI